MITPTVHFDAKLTGPVKREEVTKRSTPIHAPGTPGSGWGPKQGKVISGSSESTDTTQAAAVTYSLGKQDCNVCFDNY